MARKSGERVRPLSPIWSQSPQIVGCEDRAEFYRLLKKINDEVRPRGIIEKIFLEEFACLEWDIQRLNRLKRVVLASAILNELYLRLKEACRDPISGTFDTEKYEVVSERAEYWFTDNAVKLKVSKVLGGLEWSDSEIEAAAFAKSLAQIDIIDKMLLIAESRRDLKLRRIADYREMFAENVKNNVTRTINSESVEVPRHEDDRSRKSAA